MSIRLIRLPLVLLLGFAAALQAEKRPPNIVLLIADDLGYPYYGFMGDPHVVTPAMDTLAEGGATFLHGYSTTPYCRPSLRSIITGLHPVEYNLRKNPWVEAARDESPDFADLSPFNQQMWLAVENANMMSRFDTLPKLLGEAGYVSWQGGKWWENSYRNGHFDEGMTEGWDMSKFGDDSFFAEMMGGYGNELGRTTMDPLWDFIDEHADEPMFIWYGPMLPHYPFDAPYRYQKFYDEKAISESARRYYANITWWDDGVGQLMDRLEAKGLMEDTLFIFVNDNGWEQEAHVEYYQEGVADMDNFRFRNGGAKGKSGLFEQSLRTPIIFYWKDQIEATMNHHSLASMLDIFPTALDFAGLETPDGLQGYSLKPIIDGGQMNERTELITYTDNRGDPNYEGMGSAPHEGYALRTERWHFIYHKTFETTELYDITKDPRALRDLSDDFPELVKDFIGRIENWQSSMGMTGRIPISQ